MLQTHKHISIGQVLTIFALGLVCGIQAALYLYDLYDDGIADGRSALIAVLLIVLGLGYVLFVFRTDPSVASDS